MLAGSSLKSTASIFINRYVDVEGPSRGRAMLRFRDAPRPLGESLGGKIRQPDGVMGLGSFAVGMGTSQK